MINKRILNTEIKNYKRTGEWSQVLKSYLTEIIEVCVISVGSDLEIEDIMQDCWVFAIKLLGKVDTSKNSYGYLQTCIRHHIQEKRRKYNKDNFERLDY